MIYLSICLVFLAVFWLVYEQYAERRLWKLRVESTKSYAAFLEKMLDSQAELISFLLQRVPLKPSDVEEWKSRN